MELGSKGGLVSVVLYTEEHITESHEFSITPESMFSMVFLSQCPQSLSPPGASSTGWMIAMFR